MRKISLTPESSISIHNNTSKRNEEEGIRRLIVMIDQTQEILLFFFLPLSCGRSTYRCFSFVRSQTNTCSLACVEGKKGCTFTSLPLPLLLYPGRLSTSIFSYTHYSQTRRPNGIITLQTKSTDNDDIDSLYIILYSRVESIQPALVVAVQEVD